MMKTILSLLMLSALVDGASSAQQAAKARLDEALTAMGGIEALRRIGPLKIEVIGHGYALEQSERPEGPWLATYRQRTEIRDSVNRRLVRHSQNRDWTSPAWSNTVAFVAREGIAAWRAGDRWLPGTVMDLATADDAFDLSPERLLITAREAEDLRPVRDRTLHGTAHGGVTFSWRGKTLTLFLNPDTHLPTLLEIVRNDDVFGVWGDVLERRWFGFWSLEAGGVWYPRQVTTDWNGLPFADETVLSLTPHADLDPADLAVPGEIRDAFTKGLDRPAGLGSIRLNTARAVDLSPDVVMLPGSWNVMLVRQDDGVVVIEAPISAQYSADVLAYASRRFPGAEIRAVVTTSDAWPHIGGVREYVARGIPIYRLDLNGPILDRLATSPRTLSPDALARAPRRPVWKSVGTRTVIGRGDSRIELLPVRGELGERMMLAWLPGVKLLYASDMVQRDRSGGFFWVGLLAEVEAVVQRERLGGVERIAAMHLTPTAFTEIADALVRVRGR